MVPIIRPAGITALLSADSSINTTDCEPATDTTRPIRWFSDSSRNAILSASGTVAVVAMACDPRLLFRCGRGHCFDLRLLLRCRGGHGLDPRLRMRCG